jgi:adenylate cyclase
VPISSGIAGTVARTGQTLNIPDPYNSPDFNREVDQRTGYRTQNILSMPIFDRGKKVVAVAQLLNKQGGGPFSSDDEEAFREFATPLGLILESCLRMTHAG